MQKIGRNSHFRPLNGGKIEQYGNRILQIDTDALYNGKPNNNGFCVYMVEVDDSPAAVAEYERENKVGI